MNKLIQKLKDIKNFLIGKRQLDPKTGLVEDVPPQTAINKDASNDGK